MIYQKWSVIGANAMSLKWKGFAFYLDLTDNLRVQRCTRIESVPVKWYKFAEYPHRKCFARLE